jgi:hypothetical protein
MNAKRRGAENTKSLSVEERRARVADAAKTATGKAKKGMKFIECRLPSPDERALGESLDEMAKRVLARNRRQKAA